jgi:hypothetical protein
MEYIVFEHNTVLPHKNEIRLATFCHESLKTCVRIHHILTVGESYQSWALTNIKNGVIPDTEPIHKQT